MRRTVPVVTLLGLAAVPVISAQTANSRNGQVVFFFGDVQLEDGSPPPDPVLIERVCKSRVVSSTRTDARGHFSVSVEAGGSDTSPSDAGGSNAQAPDVLKALNRSSTQYIDPLMTALQDCELQASLAGFRTVTVPLVVHSTSDSGRVGNIVLHSLARNGALTISVTTAAAPPNAKRAYEKGLDAASRQKWETAAAEFEKAVAIYPKFAVAWYQLGRARLNRNDAAGAAEAWKEARKQDPKFVSPYQGLAALADRQKDWTASEQYSREWLQLDPEDYPAAYLINAIANARLNRAQTAELAARAGLRIDREHKLPRLNYILGLILIDKQQFAEAALCFRAYLEYAPQAPDAAAVRDGLAKLEQRAAQTKPQ